MEIKITKDAPIWYKYMLCGVLGVKENFCSLVVNGFKAAVSGTIPPSSGLSSSSALVCCAAMAMLRANSWPMTKVHKYPSQLNLFQDQRATKSSVYNQWNRGFSN